LSNKKIHISSFLRSLRECHIPLEGLRINFSTIYPILPFELGIQSKKVFKDRVTKLSIKNPKTIFPTIPILQSLSWTSVVSPCL
jgi:hypothetical protein